MTLTSEEVVRDMLRFSFGALILLFVLKGLFGQVLLNWTLPMVPVLLMIFAMRMRWSPASTLSLAVYRSRYWLC